MPQSNWSVLLALAVPALALANGPEAQDGTTSSPPSSHGAPDVVTTVGLEVQRDRRAAAVALGALFEGPHLGLGAELQGLSGDGPSPDTVQRGHLQLSYAIIASSGLRVRLEGGAAWTRTSGADIFSPLVGVSGAFGKLGALQLEAAVRIMPAPVPQAETSVGLGIALVDRFALRIGQRQLFIGEVPGAGPGMTFRGVYAGLAWTL